MAIKCFMIIESDHCVRWLRRYSTQPPKCPNSCHNAMVRIENDVLKHGEKIVLGSDWPKTDERWPKKCQHCDYEFQRHDHWQLFAERIYLTPDGLERIIRRDLPDFPNAEPGAMFLSDWGLPHWKGPDGHCLSVVLPDHSIWMIDGPSNNGDGWTRTGIPPNITATPSILTPTYHGWLRDGELIAC